jgi:iron complex outermembrane receptor protein
MMRRLSGAAAVLVASLVPALPALAQAEVEATKSGALEEVIVTAQKREESVQTTPISISVFNSDQIVNRGITDLQNLAKADTSLQFSNGGNEGWLTLRGVSSHDVTEIGDPTVPVAIDEFFTNRPQGLNASLYDIQRIEVLRGPQGTLYGRNATGGVVNITNKPRMSSRRGSIGSRTRRAEPRAC